MKELSDYERRLMQERKSNKSLFLKREKAYNRIKGIRVGDYIKDKDGSMSRVTHIWKDEKGKPFHIQNGGHGSSFYLGNRFISYSGGLDEGYELPKTKFRRAGYKMGAIWFFKGDVHTAHNGIDYQMKFKVFEVQ